MKEVIDKLEVKLDIKTLIGMILGIVSIAGIWFTLTGEITHLQKDVALMEKTAEYNNEWIINFQPPKSVQETVIGLREMKIENALLKHRIDQLEKDIELLNQNKDE